MNKIIALILIITSYIPGVFSYEFDDLSWEFKQTMIDAINDSKKKENKSKKIAQKSNKNEFSSQSSTADQPTNSFESQKPIQVNTETEYSYKPLLTYDELMVHFDHYKDGKQLSNFKVDKELLLARAHNEIKYLDTLAKEAGSQGRYVARILITGGAALCAVLPWIAVLCGYSIDTKHGLCWSGGSILVGGYAGKEALEAKKAWDTNKKFIAIKNKHIELRDWLQNLP